MAAKILLSLGPFERKICQAISNSPELEPDVARPFGEAKGEGLKIPRWMYIKNYHDATTEEFREPIKRIGGSCCQAALHTLEPEVIRDRVRIGRDALSNIIQEIRSWYTRIAALVDVDIEHR